MFVHKTKDREDLFSRDKEMLAIFTWAKTRKKNLKMHAVVFIYYNVRKKVKTGLGKPI